MVLGAMISVKPDFQFSPKHDTVVEVLAFRDWGWPVYGVVSSRLVTSYELHALVRTNQHLTIQWKACIQY